MGQDNARLAWRDRAEPGEQVLLAGMRAEAAQGVDVCFYGNFFAVNADHFLAFHQPPTERAVALIADDEDMSVRFPKIPFEMMKNATGIAHARAGHNEAGTYLIVNLHGILRR